MIREAINELKKYTSGKKNTEKIEVSVLNLNRIIFALEEPEPVLDKIRTEIEALEEGIWSYHNDRPWVFKDEVLQVIDKYRAESEDKK